MGRELQVTEVAVVDELAAAADLVMGKAKGVAAAVIRGVEPAWLRRGEVKADKVQVQGSVTGPVRARTVEIAKTAKVTGDVFYEQLIARTGGDHGQRLREEAQRLKQPFGGARQALNQALALEGVRALRTGLPEVVRDPGDLDGRERTLYGAYLAAVAFASAGSGLHHKICHTLGGLYDLPHAQTHAVVLPHVLALNAPAVPDLEQRMAAAFCARTALEGLQRLRDRVDAPRALRDYGLRDEDVPAAVEALLPAVPPDNPAPVTAEVLEGLLRAALDGEEPG